MRYRAVVETRTHAFAGFVRKVRHFFEQKNYLEVFTPAIVNVGAFESTIDPITVVWRGGRAELQTSPEIEMKKVLAENRVPLFQICKSFRDDPPTPHHRREFMMLEYYAPDSTAAAMARLTQDLIRFLAPTCHFQEASVRELTLKHTGIDLAKCGSRDTLKEALLSIHCTGFGADDAWEDLFFRLWLERVETQLEHETATLVKEYPQAISPLSAPASESGFAERFEIYWKGMEICNGCTELVDTQQLTRRYEEESRARKRAGKPAHPFPEKLIEASPKLGLCAGVAVGLDRLFSCVTGYPPWSDYH